MSDVVIARLREASWPVCVDHDTERDVVAMADAERIVREGWPAIRECVYTEDCDGAWTCSACKWAMVMEDGTPAENDYAYCPHCGARITQSVAYQEGDDGA